MIAPDGNRSATARSITIRRPLWVERGRRSTTAPSATPATARRWTACGSPSLGLIEGFEPDLIVSGINHGANLGDDITYSGTVAAALEGVVLGIPGDRRLPAVRAREMDFRLGRPFDFDAAAAFAARVVDRLDDVPLPAGHAAQHQRARRRRSAASRSRGWASASTATSWS